MYDTPLKFLFKVSLIFNRNKLIVKERKRLKIKRIESWVLRSNAWHLSLPKTNEQAIHHWRREIKDSQACSYGAEDVVTVLLHNRTTPAIFQVPSFKWYCLHRVLLLNNSSFLFPWLPTNYYWNKKIKITLFYFVINNPELK